MIYSMTGFGRAEREDKNINISVEIKSLNHRFFEAAFYLPEGFGIFEERLREKLTRCLKRGRIFFYLHFHSKVNEDALIIINKTLARKAVTDLKRLGNSLRIKDDIDIKDIISMPNIITVIPRSMSKVHLWPKINILTEKALNDLMELRCREGLALSKDISSRLQKIHSAVSIIEAETPRIINRFKGRLHSQLKGKDYNSDKLVAEVGAFLRNTDISEEVIRLKSHISNFRKILAGKSDEKGRTLDFVSQEIQREINTVVAKSASMNISNHAVKIKSEVEKIREQLSNVE